jgi:ATP-binding cassette subfamily A (ABC1) protein 3
MYEAILKTALKKPDYRFDLRLTPYPATDFIKQKWEWTDTNAILFMAAIGIGLVLTSVAGHLVLERTSGLKHLQLISGMHLKAYWIANFIFDAFKLSMVLAVMIILLEIFNLNYDSVYITMALLPWAVIPFTYVTTFIFDSESGA